MTTTYLTQTILIILIFNLQTVRSSIVINPISFSHFEPCGALIKDISQVSLYKQRDVHTSVIQTLTIQSSRGVLLQTNLTAKQMIPSLFRSYRHDCFLHIHITFAPQTLPSDLTYLVNVQSFQNQVFFLHATYVILTIYKLNFLTLPGYKELMSIRDIRHFIIQIGAVLTHNTIPMKIHGIGWYFYCCYCSTIPFVTVNYERGISSIKITSFQHLWTDVVHYVIDIVPPNNNIQESVRNSPTTDKFYCLQSLYQIKRRLVCSIPHILIQTIHQATNLNLSLDYTDGFIKTVTRRRISQLLTLYE